MLLFEVVSSSSALITEKDLQVLAGVLQRGLDLPSSSLISLAFVSEERMRQINHSQRNKNHATDVLSFATAEEVRQATPKMSVVELGDLFLCPTYARREAKRRGIEEREELMRLMVHGVMHLQGYDHATDEEEAQMFGLQEQLLERVLRQLNRESSPVA